MRKYAKILLISSLMLVGGFVLLSLVELSSDENNAEALFEMPPEIQKYQDEFKKTCKKSALECKQYGNPALVSDLDTGRIRPPQRRRVMHQSLDAIKENLDDFPSPERKRKAMENIANRMVIVKDTM